MMGKRGGSRPQGLGYAFIRVASAGNRRRGTARRDRDSAIRVAATSVPAVRSRAALLGSVWLGALAMLTPSTAQALDGTWTARPPNPKEWTQGTNWSSTPNVPDGTATFTNNGAATSVTISGPGATSIGTIQFTAAAPAYSFVVNLAPLFEINGAGIVNNSAFAPSFTNNGAMTISNGSAGNSMIVTNGGFLLSFTDTSSANNATITTNTGALTQFAANSNGGNARFITNAGGTVDF